MTGDKLKGGHPKPDNTQPYRVRLPGFIIDTEVGLGDLIKRVTSYYGVRTCRGCEVRADSLNRRLVFTSRAR
jgi:hypothetical protein